MPLLLVIQNLADIRYYSCISQMVGRDRNSGRQRAWYAVWIVRCSTSPRPRQWYPAKAVIQCVKDFVIQMPSNHYVEGCKKCRSPSSSLSVSLPLKWTNRCNFLKREQDFGLAVKTAVSCPALEYLHLIPGFAPYFQPWDRFKQLAFCHLCGRTGLRS